MAGDHLTPSPQDPSAELTAGPPALPAGETEPLVSPPPGRVEPYSGRFKIAYALLAVVLGAAVGAFIVLIGRGDSGNQVAWSGWKPQGSATQEANAIASFVGQQYRLPSGKQLVAVIPQVPPAVQASDQPVPISHIVFAASSDPQDIKVYSTGNSVEYILCGVGASAGQCAIGEGKATAQRARLLHRESLELALYTMKYVDGIDSVVALQPPKAGKNATYALFFRKDDFKKELGTPLGRTLKGRSPFTLAGFSSVQQDKVAQIVTPHVFQFSYEQAPDGSALLVLQPAAA